MQDQFIINILVGIDKFIFPALVALLTTISGFYATRKVKSDEVKNKKKERSRNFIEILDIELNTLARRLDALSKDPQTFSYFSIKKINEISNFRYSLNSKVDQDIISLPNNKIRKDIREIISEVFSVVDDINNLENYPLNKYQSYQQVEKETFQEYRKTRLQLLSDGIYIDEHGMAQFLDKKNKNKEKLKHVNKIISDLPIEWRREKENKELTEKQTASQRLLLVSQLVKCISNINRLIGDINNLRKSFN